MEIKLDPTITSLCSIAQELLKPPESRPPREDFVEAFREQFRDVDFEANDIDTLLAEIPSGPWDDDAAKTLTVIAFLFVRSELSLDQILEFFRPVLAEMESWEEWAEAERLAGVQQ